MSNDNVTREDLFLKLASCLQWLVVFALPGVLAIASVAAVCARWIGQDELRRSRASMAEQMQQIRRGELSCLVQPDPGFVDELLADSTCAVRIAELCIGGDVSDERLGRLRELPNLKGIILLFADNPDIFLERLQGMTTVEELTLEHTFPSRRGIESIRSFPKLKALCLPAAGSTISDLDGIKDHPSIESLVLTRIGCDERLLPVLKSLPRLRSVTIEDAEEDAESFEQSLRSALPNCQCSVQLGP